MDETAAGYPSLAGNMMAEWHIIKIEGAAMVREEDTALRTPH